MNVTDGSSFKDWVLVIAGNIFIVILVFRALGHYAKKEWGELLTTVLAAVFIAGVIYANDQTMTLLKNIFNMIFGG